MLNPDFLRDDLAGLRERQPLVHNITNYVVMNLTANALLAVGASPIMAHAEEELAELIGIASSLVLNIGTLSTPWIKSMRFAANEARQRSVPIVLDPVGAGASRLRTDTALALLETASPAVIRGNASEILALAGAAAATRGVDSAHASHAAANAARCLAQSHGCAVAVSGEQDFITDGTSDLLLSGGHPLMPRVTGMGCTATAIVGAFAAVSPTPFRAAIAGMATMKVAGELAAAQANGPGTFVPHFLDALHTLTPDQLASQASIG
jgi:hydroxyethylthiazole kinase